MSSKKAVKNTLFSWISLLATSVLAFVVRTLLIDFLGDDIVGANTTISGTVNLLSISELGIQTAIVYKMYKPIIDGNIKRQQELFNLYKVAYRFVGLAILVIGLCLLPFLPKLVNTVIDMRIIYAAYILQLGVVVITYWLSYYKVLYFTYQRQYVCTVVDVILSILLNIIQIIVIVATKNYLLYLAVAYASVIGSYIVIRSVAKKDYKDIVKRCRVSKDDVRELFKDVKELMIGQFAGYIYGSTDNLITSYIFGSITTGLVGNYKMVTNIMRSIMSSLATAVSPTWGNYLNLQEDKAVTKKYYEAFIFLEYCAGLMLLVPSAILIDDFVTKIWLDDNHMIGTALVYLIVFDVFMNNLNEPTCVIIRNLGMFRQEKIVTICAASTNLLSSIGLAWLMGVEGIYLGTLLAILVYWVMRSYYVNRDCFDKDKGFYVRFWINNIIYTATFVIICVVTRYVVHLLGTGYPIVDFVVRAVIIEVILVLYLIVVWHRTERFKTLLEMVKRVLHK